MDAHLVNAGVDIHADDPAFGYRCIAVHKTSEVKDWGGREPTRFQVHFTPTSASWLNLVEVWFKIISTRPCTLPTSPQCPS